MIAQVQSTAAAMTDLTEAGCHTKSRPLKAPPLQGLFANGHILVNEERAKYRLLPLVRSSTLDNLARHHAELMAAKSKVKPSCRTKSRPHKHRLSKDYS